jgi:broad specificity phosphatase PhoE
MNEQLANNILLIRHGQTNANVTGFYMGWSDEDLNEPGYTQVRRLSERLASISLASIYTSPLRRAYNTAAILAESHKLELKVLDDLIEIQLGDWQGLYVDEIKKRWPKLWQQSRINPSEITLPNGESYSQVTKRAVRALKMIVRSNTNKNTAIVTHEIIIKVLIAHVLGVPNSIYRRIDIDNGSLSIVRGGKNLQLVRLNDISHLED